MGGKAEAGDWRLRVVGSWCQGMEERFSDGDVEVMWRFGVGDVTL